MSSVAIHRGSRKAIRTLVQIIASGGLTAAVDVLAGGLSPNAKVLVGAAWLVVTAFAQNALESNGTIPALLPTPGLVGSEGAVAGKAVGTVDAVAEKVGDTVGEVTGTVTSTAGELLGEVIDVDHEEG